MYISIDLNHEKYFVLPTRKSKVGDSRENMGEAGATGAAGGGAAVAPIEETNTAEPMSEQKEIDNPRESPTRESPRLVTPGNSMIPTYKYKHITI